MTQNGKIKPPELGARIEASGYMVRHSTMRAWREANPDAAYDDAPSRGFKTWKRKRESFSGVFVGIRRMTIKRWWFTFDGEMDFHSELTPIVFWLVAYSARANPRYVLPKDVVAGPAGERVEMNGFEHIRHYYQVPAYRMRRVRVDGGAEGVITGTSGPHLLIRLDGEKRPKPYHPTWRIVTQADCREWEGGRDG